MALQNVVSNQHTSSCRMDFLSFWELKNRKKRQVQLRVWNSDTQTHTYNTHNSYTNLSPSLCMHLCIYAYSYCVIFQRVTCCTVVGRSAVQKQTTSGTATAALNRQQSTVYRVAPSQTPSMTHLTQYSRISLVLEDNPSISGLLWSTPPPLTTHLSCSDCVFCFCN